MRARRLIAALAVGSPLLLAGCQSGGSGDATGQSSSSPALSVTTTSADAGVARTIESGGVIRSVQPWSFGSSTGQAVTTDRFVIYITERDPLIAQRLPGFMEAAADHYTRALGDLPQPPDRLEMFVMSGRQEWRRLVLSMLGSKAQAAVNAITRGGMTFAGRAYLFDIGSTDTMSLASHEGWHQYTQRTFVEPLPVWLEEGIASYMEGHRWSGYSVTFAGWANIERFDQLRRAVANRQLLSLPDLLNSSPNQLVEHGNGTEALTYYAQVWSLVHFLREGADGRYREGFERLLRDAATGHLSRTVAAELSAQGVRPPAGGLSRNSGLVFQAYFGADLGKAAAEYRAFVTAVVQTGSRQNVVQGLSPL
jgi:hypothetical protein